MIPANESEFFYALKGKHAIAYNENKRSLSELITVLDDTTRKVLRILFNSYRQEWARVDMDRLQHLSGRSRQQVEGALQELAQQGYIEQREGLTRVLEGWERRPKPERHWWG